jgi:hypothetical protein
MSHFRNLFAIYCAVLGVFGGVVWASLAWAAPATRIIQGKVAFEQRYTVVRMEASVESRPCPKSEPYWTMVVTSPDRHKYEFNQPFSMGSLTAPESIEIDSVILRPGSVLQLEAWVDPINAEYSLIRKILKLQLTMDVFASPALANDEPSVPSYGWVCESADKSVLVVALLGSTGYGLRVETVDRAAEFPGAQLEQTEYELRYLGTSGDDMAELSIDFRGESQEGLGARRPGRLVYGETLALSCYPTR